MQALERILAILDSISRSPSGKTPARIAEDTGLSLSTVVRLLQSLQDEEVLLRSQGGQFRIGTRLIAMVGRSTHSFDARTAAVPILEQLRDRSGGETASLHIRNGAQRVCVAAAYTTHHSGRIVPIGMALPLPGSAVGHVLLSQMTPDSLDALLTSMRLPVKAQAELRKRIRDVQEATFAQSVNDSVDGIRGVAVGIGDENNGGALSVSGPSERFTEEKVPLVLEELRHAANVLEHSGLRLQDMRFS